MDALVADTLRTIPFITRGILCATAALMLATTLEFVSPYSLYFNTHAIFRKHEYWRLLTSVLYFGDLGIQYLWTNYILITYCGKLEAESYESSRTKFGWRVFLILLGIWVSGALFPYSLFLSSTFLSTLMYIWSRKNPDVIMNVLFFNVQAAYLSWILLVFHYLMGRGIFDHLVGILIGHVIYFLDDVYPTLPASHGKRLLDPPSWAARILG